MPTASQTPTAASAPADETGRWTDDLLKDPHAVADKRARVQAMFAAIAPSYDLNNRLHSMGIDQLWRRAAVKAATLKPSDVVVDVACGTGDLTMAFARQLARLNPGNRAAPARAGNGCAAGTVTGIDYTYEMLPIAASKAAGAGLGPAVAYTTGDATALPLPDACCDVVSIAFGIRNVADPAAAMAEFRRILRPGGRLVILEFSLPSNPLIRGVYNFYFRRVMPVTCTLLSRDKTGAYKYLPESVNTFITRERMLDMMAEAGFAKPTARPLTFGVSVVYRGAVAD
ncbi:MAG: bifunctional demethylmenaquinone methyltransferase/2-methoxy-6-polyprenyl-1,4-benzoquinol methylase UbiE [Phycisphaerae bacterium]